jgi:protein SCO1/2
MLSWVQLLVFAGGGALVRDARAIGLDPAVQDDAARQYFTDVVLVDQDGRSLRFYSDLIQGKTVIVIPFFTTCTGACPVMNQTLAKIQEWLGARLGKDAHILSISVDPATDTVPALRTYAAQYNARPGWHFIGGKRENVELALKKLGQYAEVRENHTNLMIVGNEKTGLWKKAFGLADSASLIGIVDSVLNDQGTR